MRNVAILIDGAFFLRKITSLGHHPNQDSPSEAVDCLKKVVSNHLKALSRRYGMSLPPSGKLPRKHLTHPEHQLYRIFYYDAPPFTGRATKPVSRKTISFAKTDAAIFREDFFKLLRKQRGLALRLGKVAAKGEWILDQKTQKDLLAEKISVKELKDENFKFHLRQKGVDMRMGLDVASITLKKQAEVIVLITGDSDFVSAAKLARREGIEIILDPLRHNISDDLFEHIDGLRHGLNYVGRETSEEQD